MHQGCSTSLAPPINSKVWGESADTKWLESVDDSKPLPRLDFLKHVPSPAFWLLQSGLGDHRIAGEQVLCRLICVVAKHDPSSPAGLNEMLNSNHVDHTHCDNASFGTLPRNSGTNPIAVAMVRQGKRLLMVLTAVVLIFTGRSLFGQSAVAGGSELAEMVAARDAAFRWEIRQRGEVAGCQYVRAHLVSQKWQGVDWKHNLFVIQPAEISKDANKALLVIAGGSWRSDWGDDGPGEIKLPREAELLASITRDLKSPVAVVTQIPFQPMLDGRREDALIAETFKRFYATGDKNWPLLPAMARAASASMDATIEIVRDQWKQEIDGFTVTGASKRGWTTYLVGACDPRVKAIAPMVIDMLNLEPQMKHQLAAWGKYSPQIDDYTKLGLQKTIGTPKGDQLMALVDPFHHAASLKMPKLVILGTNDAYWPVDASRFYFNQLPNPSAILNVPNNGHGLSDIGRVIGSIAALHRSVADGKPLPQFQGKVLRNGNHVVIQAESNEPPDQVYFWTAQSKDRDFRNARWISSRAERANNNRWELPLTPPASGFVAGLVEVQFKGTTIFPLSLTTQVSVAPDLPD